MILGMGNRLGDFAVCFSFTIGEEKGYWNDPVGGPTNFGITIATLSAWRGHQCTAEDVEDLEIDDAEDIYRAWYWNPIKGDLLPQRLSLCTFDAAINSGPRQAVRWLQSALGLFPDGIIGPVTVQAAQAHDNGDTVNEMLNMRLEFMKGLSNWPQNGKGWTNRINDLRCAAM